MNLVPAESPGPAIAAHPKATRLAADSRAVSRRRRYSPRLAFTLVVFRKAYSHPTPF